MNLEKVISLMKLYEKCPNCGCDSIGKGVGDIFIEENLFLRICNCGWQIEVKESQKRFDK